MSDQLTRKRQLASSRSSCEPIDGTELHVLLIPSWYSVDSSDVFGACLREQAMALAAAGIKVGVIDIEQQSIRSWWKRSRHRGIRAERDHGVETLRLFGWNWAVRSRLARRAHYVRLGRRLFRRYVQAHGRPNLLHAHSIFNGGILARRISADAGIPFVLTEHHSDFGRDRVPEAEIRRARTVAESAAERLAVSAGFAEQMELVLGEPRLKWREIPNVLGPEFVDTPLRREERHSFRFISVSYLVDVKRIDLLISAFADAFADRTDVSLDIVGEGHCRKALEQQATKLGLDEKVRFLGLLDREGLVAALDDADALVVSSEYETFGTVVIEALSRGLAVVSTACPGPRAIIGKGDGSLVPVNDVGALASAMRRLWSDRRRFDRSAIRDRCIERYAGRAVADRLLAMYRAVIARSP